MSTSPNNRNLTPPQIAERLGVAPRKVISWIVSGELQALNLAHRGCMRPRYSVSPAALAAFERARTVVPTSDDNATSKLRRRQRHVVKEYFPS